ncbi:hypothetical protein GGE09_003936 [Roseobacter sp. N2S]|nr:hypothetical protein [Roseobacter sp. N2S]
MQAFSVASGTLSPPTSRAGNNAAVPQRLSFSVCVSIWVWGFVFCIKYKLRQPAAALPLLIFFYSVRGLSFPTRLGLNGLERIGPAPLHSSQEVFDERIPSAPKVGF